MFEPKLWWQNGDLYIEDPEGVITVYKDAYFADYSVSYENNDTMIVENVKIEQV